MRKAYAGIWASGLLAVALIFAFLTSCASKPGTIQDEAARANLKPDSIHPADEDYFHDMDSAVVLTTQEAQGRNAWIVWTGGNDRLWDVLSRKSKGSLDFLKTLSSYQPALDTTLSAAQRESLTPVYKATRDNRFHYLGLINEPCFDKATGPNPNRFGLWLDSRRADCPPDPFENETKYPGAAVGARGKNLPVGSLYGLSSGIVGLRLFPNPAFDEAAAKNWDSARYYADPSYYQSADLVLPYRVGMSCGFCHVGPSPTKPPADPEHPAWANLSSNVGAQYFWVDRIFAWEADPTSFPYQMFHTARPGSLDTSLVSTDYINNPRTMNAVYVLGGRLEAAKRLGQETLEGGSLKNAQFNDYVTSGPLTQFFTAPKTVHTPHVLKDGSDSVGVLGALNRVYLNIGLFSEEWLLHFNALVGGEITTPIEIAVARKNSLYWRATEAQAPAMAAFFLKAATPHYLRDAPGGEAYLATDANLVPQGKDVFAERCARCHSSKFPEPPPGASLSGCAGANYLDCWKKYWTWTKTDEFREKMRAIVRAPDFLDNNALSNDIRVPITLLETNACSPLATNAIAGNIWDNFSSQSYKDLPSIGDVTVYDPFTGAASKYTMPGGGRGFTRPASLVSLWSTAPFLQNNTVGKFEPSPSVEGRMKAFTSAIEQMLWPERRDRDPLLGDKIPGIIDRTTSRSYLRVPTGYVPSGLRPLLGPIRRWAPWAFGSDGIQLGPIPAGTPVDLLTNLEIRSEDPDPLKRAEHDAKVLEVLTRVKDALASIPPGASDDEAKAQFAELAAPLYALSKCPDYVVNRGHYFGTDQLAEEPGLDDGEKRALIAFLKTF